MNSYVNGVILVNKPQGITSNTVVKNVKRLFGALKVGHTGSLDPLATGMLPICLGEATKFASYLLSEDKSYEVTGCLGIKTDTADSTGTVIQQRDPSKITVTDMLNILPKFQGEIKQVPSMYSALKYKGKALYTYARAGQTVEREARPVTIYRLLLVTMQGNEFKLMVQCSKGTYIRNLVEDIGEYLGVGAHVTSLHRPYTAGFRDQRMLTLAELDEMAFEKRFAHLIEINTLLSHIPAVNLSINAYNDITQGRYIQCDDFLPPELSKENNLVRLVNPDGFCFGLGEYLLDGRIKPKRLMNL